MRSRRALRTVALIAALGGLVPGLRAAGAQEGGAAVEPRDVVGPEQCAKCHREEHTVWAGTAHAAIYRSEEPLHQRPQAREIAAGLGITLIKHDSLCLSCHYTPQLKLGRTTAVAGVSCESCHGAAGSWLTVHNNFEGRQASRHSESPAQRSRRETANAAAGMFARGRFYALVSRCYDCHTVPEEELVARGGHPGGGGFDLLERFDRIRHNFVTGGRQANAPISAQRRRELYLAGVVLELEHALRNLGRGTPGTPWSETQAERVRRGRKAIQRLQRRVSLPLLQTALELTEELPGTPPRPVAATAAARALAAAAEAFIATVHPSVLEPLDAVLDGVEEPDPGDPETGLAGAAPDGTPREGAAVLADGSKGAGEAAGPEARPAGARSAGSDTAALRQEAQGERRSVLRQALSPAAVVDPSTCTGCHQHAEATRKLRSHPHNQASDRFFGGGRAAQIAFYYFGRRADGFVARGTSVCMGCHATVIGGEEREEVSWGVSCQSCHGGAADYLKPHQQPGLSRAQRLGLGIVDLSSPRRRAEVCAACHSLTAPRLLSAGHPSGAGFDYLAGLGEVRHWERRAAEAELASAWTAELRRRGAPPEVRVVELGGPPGGGAGPAGAALSLLGSSGAPQRRKGASSAVRPPPPRPFARGTATADRAAAGAPGGPPGRVPVLPPLELGPLPEDLARRPLPEILAEIQRRLARMSAVLSGAPP